jgi:hypothetical protein
LIAALSASTITLEGAGLAVLAGGHCEIGVASPPAGGVPLGLTEPARGGERCGIGAILHANDAGLRARKIEAHGYGEKDGRKRDGKSQRRHAAFLARQPN